MIDSLLSCPVLHSGLPNDLVVVWPGSHSSHTKLAIPSHAENLSRLTPPNPAACGVLKAHSTPALRLVGRKRTIGSSIIVSCIGPFHRPCSLRNAPRNGTKVIDARRAAWRRYARDHFLETTLIAGIKDVRLREKIILVHMAHATLACLKSCLGPCMYGVCASLILSLQDTARHAPKQSQISPENFGTRLN